MKKSSQKLNYYRILSILTILLGVVLLMYMIKVEDEPGALPLILIISGIGWFILNQLKVKNLY